MSRRLRLSLVAGGFALLIAVVSALGVAAQKPGTGAGPLVTPAGPGTRFFVGLWGDMPYARAGDGPKIPALIADINAADLAFSIFDGDIKDGSSRCDDAEFSAAIERFDSLVAPMIYVPGDNEWTDCHRTNNGGFNNLERLDHLRRTMFASPESFGQRRLLLEHQGPLGGRNVESTRWLYGDLVFVGLNVPGSNNN